VGRGRFSKKPVALCLRNTHHQVLSQQVARVKAAKKRKIKCRELGKRRQNDTFLTNYRSRMPDLFQVLAALKKMHREILELRKDIDTLRDEVKTTSPASAIQLVLSLRGRREESDSDSESVQSAP
jgi:hypothetical protein